MSTETWDVVVVGSCMIDLICYAPRLPKNGETLKGTDFCIGFGGKGANQCVAAKKLGARALFVGRVGSDTFGKNYLKRFEELDILTKHVSASENVTTGMAQITVADDGQNHIIIVPGANNLLTEKDLQAAEEAITNCKVLLCQMEIDEKVTKRALEMKRKHGLGISIFNGAPATADVDPDLFTLPDIFCVNETEAEIFTGYQICTMEDAEKCAKLLIQKGCREVIITLGEKGAFYASNDGMVHIPCDKVAPIDTTGAGDAFLGALGYYIATFPEMKMTEVIRKSCDVASLSVQRRGTQDSFPTASELR